MTTAFEIVTDDFLEDLTAIKSLVETFSGQNQPAKARIAAANSATLLLAATFEEFVREMARTYARLVVSASDSFERLPASLASTAWKRTMVDLSKIRLDDLRSGGRDILGIAQTRFQEIYEFCKGDLTKDIYGDLIYNEMNMRAVQINGLFKLSGMQDVCRKCSDKQPMFDMFGETETGKVHAKFLATLDDFFERRNEIAHALNRGQSNGPQQILTDIDMLESFGRSLRETLTSEAPSDIDPQMVQVIAND